ncbi:hypothetical protein [Oxynema aestuarii]|uniref:Uncharacterized protein n=1 Tax=Oxynema aestuarii AP17 TaxID=2064643 RepID=A0A6H1TUB1_9CYAN|nr:hypothetical protein [Oxynema aestuarii]QIZ70194.1 hypothetical protein HCG48_06105 [Oxynema aestuarii AP17]
MRDLGLEVIDGLSWLTSKLSDGRAIALSLPVVAEDLNPTASRLTGLNLVSVDETKRQAREDLRSN